MTDPRRFLIALAAILGLAACSALPAAIGPPAAPAPCAQVYSSQRCTAIDDRVAEQPGIDPSAIVDVLIVPVATVDEHGNLMTRGGADPLEVRIVFADGSSRDIILGCGGIPDDSDPMCTDDPHLRAASVTMGGYRDIPCGSEGDPADCASPHASIDPDVEVESQPITFERVEIPITAAGPVEFVIGSGSLPNGILTEASFAFEDDWPDHVTLRDGTAVLQVRSLEPDGKPFDNYYAHGWREGLERIEAVLVFDVRRFEPGATLAIEDVLVR